jgi:putative ABC transport system permease protein
VATPLLIGAKGSPLELALNSLYFDTEAPNPLSYSEASRVRETGLAQAIPLYVRFKARGHPIVGTSLDYFEFRGLRIARGQLMQRLGDCVLGAALAKEIGSQPGDWIVSSPETVFDIAGVYPLRMRVTGVLEFANSPDDHAVFTDVKTTWIIEGLAHGHTDLSKSDATTGVLRRDGNRITANASVLQYNEITEENIGSFHFHGDMTAFPITAAIVLPPDEKSAALLRGRYQDPDEDRQIIVPTDVIASLLATVLTVQHYVTMGMILLGGATLATASMVFLLSLRLRRREIETLHKIGGEPMAVLTVCAFEVLFVLCISMVLAAVLAGLTWWVSPNLIRMIL